MSGLFVDFFFFGAITYEAESDVLSFDCCRFWVLLVKVPWCLFSVSFLFSFILCFVSDPVPVDFWSEPCFTMLSRFWPVITSGCLFLIFSVFDWILPILVDFKGLEISGLVSVFYIFLSDFCPGEVELPLLLIWTLSVLICGGVFLSFLTYLLAFFESWS